MAVYVDYVSLADLLKSLLNFLNTVIEKDFSKLGELLEQNKQEDFFRELTQQVNIIFETQNEKVIESFFTEFSCILRKFENEEFQKNMANLTVEQIISSTETSQLRLRMLSHLYNFFPTTSNFRYNVFEALLKYAIESKSVETIIPHFTSIELLLSQWGASVEQKRNLFKLIHQILNSTAKYEMESYKVLFKYLSTFENCDDATLASAQDAAASAAVQAIKLDDIHQCDDLLELKAVNQLQKNEKTEKLYELLSLFAGEKLDSFATFHQKYPSYLEEVGLSHEDCLKKIRLLSLATLSSEYSEINYSKIAETLNIPLDDVEDWVISAICAGLLEAKMDQLRQVVIVQRCTQRVFTNAHWVQLKDTIDGWKNNVSDLLQVIRSSKQFSQKV